MEIGAFIRARRKKLELTQEDAAHALGYDQYQMISNIERGVCSVPVFKLPKLAECLQVAESEILDTTYKGRRLGDNRDVRFLFERTKNKPSAAHCLTLDQDDEPELYRIVVKARNSKMREKFIKISKFLFDLT